jgi:hypothetical protein
MVVPSVVVLVEVTDDGTISGSTAGSSTGGGAGQGTNSCSTAEWGTTRGGTGDGSTTGRGTAGGGAAGAVSSADVDFIADPGSATQVQKMTPLKNQLDLGFGGSYSDEKFEFDFAD